MSKSIADMNELFDFTEDCPNDEPDYEGIEVKVQENTKESILMRCHSNEREEVLRSFYNFLVGIIGAHILPPDYFDKMYSSWQMKTLTDRLKQCIK